jgi:hypothetical protein
VDQGLEVTTGSLGEGQVSGMDGEKGALCMAWLLNSDPVWVWGLLHWEEPQEEPVH